MRGGIWIGVMGVIGVAVLGLPATPALAHGGGLNAEGCHTNRKTGDYHCHRAPVRRVVIPDRPLGFVDPGAGAFRNCKAARAAGAAPVRIGELGYGPHLDRDGDGIGCE